MIFSSFEFVLAVVVGWVIVFFISRIPRDTEEKDRSKTLTIRTLMTLFKRK